ncbi:hypothetical protein A8C32_11565 [Flavivirga aquatica]|uniref:Carrier domain-containing protein n=1 Tax=Flavivirga aquatica TaxID=1849968 RepID=A0A1E5TDB6_9FLAO|nr:SDR family NAD(P)-dependent oxidoreductase [Flavivirga aquatica]OEK09351.1 hypothetical protein A8C32_11565 [Flavivirga aquatica]
MTHNIKRPFTSSIFYKNLSKKYTDKKLFTFQDDNNNLTYLTGETLVKKIVLVSSILQKLLQPQNKVIILLPQGMEYISSLLACFHANVTAIPTALVSIDGGVNIKDKILPIFQDSDAKCIITDTNFKKLLEENSDFANTSILCVDELEEGNIEFEKPRKSNLEDIALLLYTSGSTSKPKGVMLTQSNIMSQAMQGVEQWDIQEESCIVSWMPQFHSFGLFFNFITPLLKGASSVILPPDSFVSNPYKWFEIISKYQATHTAAPNFAFDYCCSSIDVTNLKGISLSSLKGIICGGEPVRKETYENFVKKFKVLGLKNNMFCPHYGMSEVGSVTTKRPTDKIGFLSLDIPSLKKGVIKLSDKNNISKSVSSCGIINEDVKILCVNPETNKTCQPDEVGEIWIKSPSVGKGYLNQLEETKKIFNRTIEGSKEMGFFRTGDLGFIQENHLYIIGREKEVMIINGKNYHPVDIEWVIKNKLPDLMLPLCVFSCELDQQEKIIIVQETEALNLTEYKNLSQEVLNCVAEAYMLEVYEVNLVKKGTIPKTGSGKIQRKNCRNLYKENKLSPLYNYQTGTVQKEAVKPVSLNYQDFENEILKKLKDDVFSNVLDIESTKIENKISFGELGFDSIKYIKVSRKIEEEFNIKFEPVMFFKHRTIDKLAQYLSTQIERPDVSNIQQPEEEKTYHKVNTKQEDTNIAVIGISCNFPGEATNPELFWENIVNKKDCISAISQSRPQVIEDYQSLYDESVDFEPKWGGFIKDVDQFDAGFFGISPLEAESMDPQQRKILQLTWNVIEDGGYDPATLGDKDIGLFVGVHSNDYAELISKRPDLIDIYGAYIDSGLHMSMIPHRVSRWFNFHGPSEVINTACSSSLVAIHHAIESINKGECSMAIAGGINLILSSRIYIASHKAGMLSKDGHCKTFDDSADGFVRSEGYGAVLLKPYKEALKDNDTIYGVIKGATINHDGQSNSLRAPNLNAQKQLIKSAYKGASIPADTISYIEAHGTGTSLGDPIEFQALKEAFEEMGANASTPFCGLGAVKSVIGHSESAAGIAGFIKVLLSIRAKTLPGILHFDKLNKYISLEKTPFYIIDKTQEWEQLKNENEQEIPRRAGISSFGFGGGNAHVIVEEHIPVNEEESVKFEKVIIPFSAKNRERLLVSVQKFIGYLEVTSDKRLNLLNLSYTLQVGRNDMEERVVFLVKSIQELKEKVNLFIEGNNDIEDYWYGNNSKDKGIESQLGSDEDSQELIGKWFAKNKFNQIAQHWAQGANIKWHLLYKKNKPYRINLPTYPFAETRYWIPDSGLKTDFSFNRETIGAIHPLLQQNTSDFSEQRFSTTFTGKEFFLSDHIVNGQRVLPGVIYLEMARASLENSYGILEHANNGFKISNITWNHPVVVDKEPVQLHIALYIEENERIDYEVYTESPDNHSETTLHSQGCLIVESVDPIILDLDSIRATCSTTKITAEELYGRFNKKGIDYGSSFMRVEGIHLGEGVALAKLNLPSSEEGSLNQFVLHPGILDAAFHASSVFVTGDEQHLALPYKIKEVEIHGNCSSKMWAKIEHCNYGSEQEEINTFNIMLCDDEGNVCVNIKELAVVRVENSFGKNKDESEAKTLILTPDWKEHPFSGKDDKMEFDERLLILIEPEEVLVEKVEAELKSIGVRSIVFKTQEQEIEERYTNYTLKLFKELQSVIKDGSNKKIFIQVVASTQGKQKTFMGLVGMLKTAFQEYPNSIVQFIGVDFWKVVTTALLNDNSYRPWEAFIQHKNNKRYTFDWNTIEDYSYKEDLWKTDGVYIITGGMGGLGMLFAQEIISKAEHSVIILTGRSVLNEERKKKIQKLEGDSAIVEYKQTDITQINDVQILIKDIVERFGKLNGIIHSAGIIHDNYIIKKTEAELKEVLQVKVHGLINLDKASSVIPLDFIILFSSIAGSLGNPGQADYSAANAFMDNFAVYRNDLLTFQKRFGHTLSVNWPLWKEGGMQVNSDVEGLMKQNMGMLPMKTSNGLESLYRAFASGKAQVMVIEGYEEKINAFIKQQTLNESLQKSLKKDALMALPTISPELLEEKAVNYFKNLLSSFIRLPVKEIDANAHMDKYGIDSIMIMQLTSSLEKVFGILPKTLFFEYKSIKTLTGYFLEDFNTQLIELLGLDKEVIETNTSSNNSKAYKKPVEIEAVRRKRTRFTYENNSSKKEKPLKKEDIAIIGLAGQYPDSEDVNEFWNVLKNGKDCITEIPKERWDSSLYFDENRHVKGKTYTKWGGFLDGVDQFDPLFFNISPLEAEMMDPQERLFLQCVHKAIEDAGYSKESLMNTQEGGKEGSVGVFAGVMFQEYQLYGAQEQAKGNTLAISGNIASIANRVSYFYNLHGPSMTVDTMCSSSLSALHLACQSIHNSECEFAIAGGVNISIHPNKYLLLAQGNFASSKGKCESFGQGGDGYVPGEGVGAVLLKPLSKAIEDGNHIYGIVKSTAINHGGKTNGYTVPNPNAQADVIEEALNNAGIDPGTINYMEAHGTGTSLGDPIEIAGLTKVFKKYAVENQFCTIGSVKSNIGHCESAAGMAGITKILLQMKYKQLVPSLHSKELNPNIDFNNSPFVVQQELAEWKSVELTENGRTKEYPRRAGLSSFGAGGSNAHVIIEEYVPAEERGAEIITTKQNPAIILLSAKDEVKLKEQAGNMLKALKRQEFSDKDLINIAYTLQVGRSAMEERMAMIVTSLSQLEDNLVAYLENKNYKENIYCGNTKRDKSLVGVLGVDDDIQKVIGSWINKKKYEKVLDLWVAGLNVDWEILYNAKGKPKRVSLPTYPFAKERYWVPFSESSSLVLGGDSYLHPLIHKNTSNLEEQKFSSTFTGKESFLLDHNVRGEKTLPGVAYLELARFAGSLSLEVPITQFRDVKWLHPISVNESPFEIQVGIFEDSEGLGYEVYSGSAESELIHSQGTLGYGDFSAPSPYDISALRSGFLSEKSGSSFYTIFKDLGIEYGSGFQGVEALYYSPEGCLSKIGLSRDSDYELQPGVLDSALQTCLGFSLDNLSLGLPYSIKEVTLYGDVSQTVWCYARKSSNDHTNKVSSYDIDLLSESGDVLLRMRDFVTLPADGFHNQGNKDSNSLTDIIPELHLYDSSWNVQVLDAVSESSEEKGLVILSGGSVSLSDKLRESLESDVVTVNEPDELSYYNKLQELIQSNLGTKVPLRITVLYRNSEYLDYGFITGLLRTAEHENPKLTCKTIGIDSLSVKELDNLKHIINSEFLDAGKEVRYLNGEREVRGLRALPLNTDFTDLPVKEGGVYLITGGCGGLGLIFASHFSSTPGVQLVLTGRRKESRLNDKELLSLGAVYYSCDVSDKEDVFSLISHIKDTYGRLDGIVHSAGVLRDGFLLNKTIEEASQVLAPKILGTKYLDEATKDLALNFMVYFSSTAGVFGNVGQADYSSGNAWMDFYASYRNDLVLKGKRHGISLSINWPLWSEGGMRIDKDIEKHMESRTGLLSLPTADGIIAFDSLLSRGITQGAVFYGHKDRLERSLLKITPSSEVETEDNLVEVTDKLQEATIDYMKSIFSSVLKLPSERIDIESSFSQYGIDSIMISKLTNRLSDVFEDLPVTLLFEHQTLSSLSAYFSKSYPKRLLELTGLNEEHVEITPVLSKVDFEDIDKSISRRKRSKESSQKGRSFGGGNSIKEDIAIIGLSGRYPGATTLEDFWENLKMGKDAITEIPLDRWDAEGMYDPEKGELGKISSKWGGFIDDVDKFDPLFFNISPREAELMDPQERLFLQTAWETIEDAGYTLDQLTKVRSSQGSGLGGHVGVYAGVMYGEYQLFGAEETLKGNPTSTWCSPSSIANRVSYALNLHGPSMGVDTMCSSSLVSIHLAIDAIRNGLCSMAIAGGVNVSIHPNKYKNLSQNMFVSDKGRCESFGEGGNGYVPSEGVGAVLLKPLSQAEADGDQIYGVIKGSSLNHGGKANGYTVPNPKAQAAVIQEAIARAGVSPDDFSYIEAHGTGTSLGDPIEIAGLSKAFKGSKEGQYCAIGSIKSNIGHAESAAGISGVTKVLLQLKHKQLVPSLHSERLNPNIDFEKTPFKVQQKLEDWVSPKGRSRLAGLSSFGAGGSNAHLIIEEYVPIKKKVYESKDAVIIVLSAKDKDRLKEQVINLESYLIKNPETNIYDLAYTLQIGRESMEERLAFVADGLTELKGCLGAYSSGEISGLFIGNSKKENSSFSLEGEAGEAYIETAISKQEYAALVQLWVKGAVIDWGLLYKNNRPSIVSLPPYPFAKERYWIPVSDILSPVIGGKGLLHPLLHSNESSLLEQKYQSIFTGKESFLSDHTVQGDKVLPGVVYLELARVAGSLSLEAPITQFRDVKWLQPIRVNSNPVEVQVGIFEDAEGLGYEIYSGSGDSELIHSEGSLSTANLTSPESYEISSLLSSFSSEKDSTSWYEIFKDLGIQYGTSFKGVETLYYNQEGCLSKIGLSRDSNYVLQPGVLDSALQTCLGLSLNDSEINLNLPYSIKEVTIYGDVSQTVWCYVRKSSDNSDRKISSYDIDLLSELGEVLLSMRDFVTLPLDGIQNSVSIDSGSPSATSPELLIYGNTWNVQLLNSTSEIPEANGLVVLCGGSTSLSEKLGESLGYNVMTVNESDELTFYNKLQELVQSNLETKDLLYITVVYRNSEYLNYGFITGLLRTAEQENPKLICKTIGLERLSVKELDDIGSTITSEFLDANKEVRYQGNLREVRNLEALPSEDTSTDLLIKENGVYVITGGCGGLGHIFATYFSSTPRVQLILTGRRKESRLNDKELASLGAIYYSCDVSNKESVSTLISYIKDTYGKLDGVIHSAGVLRDSFLLNKTIDEAAQVLAPKILGTKYLDEATKEFNLDFMVYFSSTAGAFGNVGQADYSSGNAWMDYYAVYRNDLVSRGKRHGLSLSINWPLWTEGGMRIDKDIEKHMESRTGLLSLATSDGVIAFEHLLSTGISQGAVFYGYKDRLERSLLKTVSDSRENRVENSVEATDKLLEATTEYVKAIFSSVLKLSQERIDTEDSFSQYGIDSIMVSKLTNRLSEVFEDLPVTLLFEYQTISSLSTYFAETYTKQLLELTGLNKDDRGSVTQVLPKIDGNIDKTLSRRKRAVGFSSKGHSFDAGRSVKEDIAIIGLSGRYPGAATLEDFWENLKMGKDAITEIPLERWDVEGMYDQEKGKLGKISSKWGGFIDDVDKFDPLFFNISPREAELMDPQERLFLQTAWETIEDAGYTLDQLAKVRSSQGDGLGGHVGVYAGVMYGEYQLFGAEETVKGNPMATWFSSSSIANRVSYCLNLHGPSMGVDTMCSSSLVSIHLAIDAIRNGLCSMAIAGGVNVSIHPNKYKNLSKNLFVSDKGRCESFGEGGNGYVPSEGVGAVLLKPLSQAEADGDQIYGVIKGSSLNHGGKANGYTVPNPNAQAGVIQEAIERAGVSPDDFSYIEAHGTGTSLGDPIEIAGLSKAFKGSKVGQYCAIGSIKSNIGHAESAAGISGVTKVLLQLKHKQLVPSLHSKTLNPSIDFENTPFRVQQDLEDWTTPEGNPRLAGISAFGAGGSNAHLIIEEYVPKERQGYQSKDAAIVVLSAKNKDRLQEQVINLQSYLDNHQETNIYDLAYTLQIGRESMEERLAFIVKDIDSLLKEMELYLSSKKGTFFSRKNQETASEFLLEGEAGKGYMEIAIRKKESRSLVQLWVGGAKIDWQLLYEKGDIPNKISLPTYPFTKEHYWVTQTKSLNNINTESKLHPLLHRNESDLTEQKFQSTFTGKELYFLDHKVGDEKVLPGAAYLELAREAGQRSLRAPITQIKEITWLSPIAINETKKQINISIFEEGSSIGYEIYSNSGDKELIHSRGKLSKSLLPSVSSFNINEIKNRTSYTKQKVDCYSIFKKLGLNYGESFQGIEALYYNDSESLGKINLSNEKGFILQPGLLDSALQTCLGTSLNDSERSLSLPFSVKEVNIYDDVSKTSWCYVKKNSRNKTGDKISSYNINLLSNSGDVLLNFIDFVVVPLDMNNTIDSQSGIESEELKTHLYQNTWKEKNSFDQLTLAGYTPLIVLAGGSAELAERLQTLLQIEVIVINEDNEINYYKKCKELVKSKFAAKSKHFITVIYSNEDYVNYSFISGLLKSANRENSRIIGKTIGIPDSSIENFETVHKIIESEKWDVSKEVRYNGIKREVRELSILKDSFTSSSSFEIKEGGIYIITGGSGGLGEIFARYISETKDTKLILAGRSKKSRLNDSSLQNLNAIYRSCDISNSTSVNELIKEIVDTHGRLDGIIHSAGVLRDRILQNEIIDESETVLSPKIIGTKNLDQATKDLDLDFMIFFSSISGAFGNIGQSDYSSGNAWMDNYSSYRNNLRKKGKRKGVTISINWPLWKEGVMQIDEKTEQYMKDQIGLYALQTKDGVDAFNTFLSQEVSQGAILYGQKSKLSINLVDKASSIDQKKSSNITELDRDKMKEGVNRYLKDILSKTLKLSPDRIEDTIPFGKYGVDSIMIVSLTNNLNTVFEDIPSTLFFEYNNVSELSDYFIQEYPNRLLELIDIKKEDVLISQPEKIYQPKQVDLKASINTRKRFVASEGENIVEVSHPVKKEGIAIIGLSGRYPGAATLEDFWDNLKMGKDSITEIPLERWDVEGMYDPEKGKVGKIASKWGGFIDNVDKFDPLFFNISPREAELMDPQERLFLQTAWETIEDAGYTLDQLTKVRSSQGSGLGGHVGVYAGVMYGEYQLFGAEETVKGNPLSTWCSPSSIANRVSYSLNLHGPSMGVDTMCSSSLVSIHLAIDAIRNGLCSMAIAGGVNVSIHPNKYKNLSQQMFVSDKGRCESFGEGGNGYVPSEGVGAVLLKPLSQAEADGDQIYGVIKGSSLNHGGKANGYTVPNPNAQAGVIQEAIERAGVSPDDFSYIEAHGTGTSLGDPIEIAGLSKAFKGSKVGQYCAIGSIKSNIGHAESAAGISGVTKVLLQLKHKQLVPSLHSKTLNKRIDFENTPFKVQQDLTDWIAPEGNPRLAGISAFGAGGSNAHLIIEEYVPKERQAYQSKDAAAIVLSAKNKDRLQELVINLQSYLDNHQETNIYDLAYTLQVGREPMEERLAFVANNLTELKDRLISYSSGILSNLFVGNVEDENSDLLLEGKALDLYIKTVLSERQPKSLTQLWVRGITIDWHSLYDKENSPDKISLPTYPFKKVGYWIPKLDENKPVISNSTNYLHPLLHFNNSKFNKQFFTSKYTGLESFLTDHKVGGEKMLPGVAYLELAREAGCLSKETDITQIKDIIWTNPISVNGKPESIEISLSEEGDSEITYTVLKNTKEDRTICGQGVLSTRVLVSPELINIEEIKNLLFNEKEGSECYNIFRKIGLDYGSSFQGIEKLWYSDTVALSKINLPRQNNYVLQPGIMDTALQTCIILEMGIKDNSDLAVPFSVKEVNIYGNVLDTCWCIVRKKDSGKRKVNTSSYDIDLLSDKGDVLLSFRSFIILPVVGKPNIEKKPQLIENTTKTHYYTDYWQTCDPEIKNSKINQESKLVLLAGGSEELSKILKEKSGLEAESLKHHVEVDYFNEIFQKIKKIIKNNVFKDITIIYNNKDFVKYGFVSGLLKTAERESQKIIGRMIGVDSLSIKSIDKLVDVLKSENQTEYIDIRYKNNVREEKCFKPITSLDPSGIKIKEGGIYFITGGAGGLGFVFAEHISKTKNTKLILTGRSELSNDKKFLLKSIPNSEYISCDVTDSTSVTRVIKNIIKTHGKLDGIIHSAGINSDSLIINKMPIEVEQVLHAKIQGAKNLDKATKNISLDFFMLFSSVSGVFGNAGQSAYSAGNAYLDNFVKFRNEMKDKGERSGNSYSINWPLWIDGGMYPKEEVVEYLFTQFGLKPLPSKEGVAIFDRVLENNVEGNLVLFGQNIEKLEKNLLYQKTNEETLENMIEALISNNSLDSIEAFINEIPDEDIEGLITAFTKEENLLDKAFDDDIENMVNSLLEMDSTDSIDAILDQLPEDSLKEIISIIKNF